MIHDPRSNSPFGRFPFLFQRMGRWFSLLFTLVVVSFSVQKSPGQNPSKPSHSQPTAPRFVLEWGKKGTKAGEFHSPVHISISSRDEVFVADLNNSRVQQFTTEGQFVNQWDLPADQPPKRQCVAGGLTLDKNGNLYVSYMVQNKIQVYTPKGKLLREWGKKGKGDGEFFQPGGMVIRPDGALLVADQCNHRIQEFTHDGKFLRKWGQHGTDPGMFGGKEPAGSRFAGPHFLALDKLGRLYTTEGVQGRIQQFSPEGKFLASWGDKVKEPGAFGEYHFGNLKNTFGPIGIVADKQGRIWVSSLNDRVQAFTPEGKFLFRLDGVNEDEDTFAKPHGLAIDSKGFLYVADSSGQRIVKFQLPP